MNFFRSRGARASLTALAAALALFGTACTAPGHDTAKPDAEVGVASKQQDLRTQAEQALERLYRHAPAARDIVEKSVGVLVFPKVDGSFATGAEYGRGVLFMGGATAESQMAGRYRAVAGALGWNGGTQSRSLIYVFNHQSALAKFSNSRGWMVGLGATAEQVMPDANGKIDASVLKHQVIVFSDTDAGLKADVSVEGSVISRINDVK